MEINLYNIREKIFSSSELQKKLSFFKPIFDQWNIAYSVGGMVSRMKMFELELLNALNSDHEDILKKHFSTDIKIKKIDNNLSKNYIVLNNENLPKEIEEYREFCISASRDKLYLTFWR
jgi:uncharacterized protein YjaZ